MHLLVVSRRWQDVKALDVFLLYLAAWLAYLLPWPWVVLCIVAPLFEELIFRLGIQEHFLKRCSVPIQANILTALLFALSHALLRSWYLGAMVLLPALFLGWLYQYSRALGLKQALRRCIVAHSLMNAIYLWFGLNGFSSLG